jgi:hypothetical protein
MNATNAKDYLPLVQALAEGKQIQVKILDGWSGGVGWVDFIYDPSYYRIKPEPRRIWVRMPREYEEHSTSSEDRAKLVEFVEVIK